VFYCFIRSSKLARRECWLGCGSNSFFVNVVFCLHGQIVASAQRYFPSISCYCIIFAIFMYILFLKFWVHMKNTRRNTCTGTHYAMPVRQLLINFGKTKTNPNPDPNRYRRRCPDPNSTQLNSTGDYGRRCLTPLCPHH